ncbi:flavodoxin family protein, partial [Candidatus Omnitrophota bacterium]
LGSPVNFGGITAIMKRFIERLIVYEYWPWTGKFPRPRIKERNKKTILLTSGAAPAFIGKILMPGALKMMKEPAEITGSKVVKTIYSGLVCLEEKQKLNKKQLRSAQSAAGCLLT